MRLRFARTGGFAGAKFEIVLDTEDLPQERRAAIERLVAQVDKHGLPARTSRAPQARDAFHYDLRVEEGERAFELDADDASASPPLRALARLLTREARVRREAPRRR